MKINHKLCKLSILVIQVFLKHDKNNVKSFITTREQSEENLHIITTLFSEMTKSH